MCAGKSEGKKGGIRVKRAEEDKRESRLGVEELERGACSERWVVERGYKDI